LGEQARDGDWPLLHGLADDVAPVTRRAALDALAHYRDKAREQFVNGLADADARVRIAAARALCTVNDDRGLPVLVEHDGSAGRARLASRNVVAEQCRRLAHDSATACIRRWRAHRRRARDDVRALTPGGRAETRRL
jgi:hypothetical protein